VSNNSRILIKLNKKIKIHGFGFKSANDCPHRDPDEVEVSYLAENYSNSHLANFNLNFKG